MFSCFFLLLLLRLLAENMGPSTRVLGFFTTIIVYIQNIYIWWTHWKFVISELPYHLRKHTASNIRSHYLSDSNKHDKPPSNSLSQILYNMWHEKIKSLSEEMLLCCQQMAASARSAIWRASEYPAFMFDEVNVCVLSAAYSSWSLSHGAPSDTYGVICLNSSAVQEMGRRKMALELNEVLGCVLLVVLSYHSFCISQHMAAGV